MLFKIFMNKIIIKLQKQNTTNNNDNKSYRNSHILIDFDCNTDL